MTGIEDDLRFSRLFNRAVVSCVQAQQLAARCRESQARARAAHASARRIRALAAETRTAWADSNVVFGVMRREVGAVALAMREAGVAQSYAGAAVRAQMRFVLYDGGLTEQDAESVIVCVSAWVNLAYAAA